MECHNIYFTLISRIVFQNDDKYPVVQILLPGGDGTLLKAQGADGQWYLIDWHGGLLFPEASPYPVSMLIAPDGSALLVESEDGKTAYIVTR